ncbi:MAG TPA: hypothetical protein VFH39_01105, partial [Candidatus Saccharimonadales bacterium]|nr:hypothetical protein [Candidatus Saccharimonadales bacterium]
PTHGGMATPAMHDWLNDLPTQQLRGLDVAAFDTRVPSQWVKIIGFASKRMATYLEKRGANLVALPMGFYVRGKTGPLKKGERERAKAWARQILQTMVIMHDHGLGVA